MTRHPKGSFQVKGGTVIAGVDPLTVLFESTDGQREVSRTCQLRDGWYELLGDGTTRAFHRAPRHGPPRQHQRPVPRRARTRPSIRGKHTVVSLLGQVLR